MSKILVIGHSVLDRIYYEKNLTVKPGGIYHAVNVLVNLIGDEDEIYLATHYSNNYYKHFSAVYENVNLSFSKIVESIPVVTLHLYKNKEREEKYSSATKEIYLSQELFSTKFDIVLVNMISGFDITLNSIKKLKKNLNCEIYFDLHTLSRGFDESGERIFRKVPRIEEWLSNIDILQMNENEIETLWGINSEKENVKKLFEHGIEKVIVTKGKRGVSLYYKGVEQKIPSLNVDAVNVVGCGDSFGAAFCYYYSKNKNLNRAANFANFVAGTITTYKTENDFNRLKDDITKRYDKKTNINNWL